jgi:CheY-like chemotaxis protein
MADDEATFLHSTCELLRKEGYGCDCVASAGEALEALDRAQYDLLIADIRMPGNPNLELIHGLQARGGDLPVILVTGYPSLGSALEAIRLPVLAYLVKPFEFPALLDEVVKAVSWSRLRRAVGCARQRLDGWRTDLADVEGSLKGDLADTRAGSVDAFLAVTMRNIAGSLADLERIAQAVAGRSVAPDACHLLNCPRHRRLTDALEQTIGVLERTKSSFKSRELGELRRVLAILLEEERRS